MSELRWATVVFDLDGTLADTIDLIVASYQHAFTTVLGHEEDPAVIRSWIGRPLVGAFREHSPQHAEALYATYLQWNSDNTERLIRSYDGVVDVLGELREAGVHVGIATSKRRESARQAMDILGISPHVDVLVAMEDTEVHKPDPTPLLLALERMGRGRDGAVYVGDAVVDVLAGQAAGMDTLAVTWGAGLPTALRAAAPTVLATTADELRTAFLG